MSAEKILEEFEAAYLRGDFYAAEQDSVVQFQDYRKHCAYVAFTNGWKASRAAIEVTLPDYTNPFYGGDHFDECQYAADCEKAIESLGLKVAP